MFNKKYFKKYIIILFVIKIVRYMKNLTRLCAKETSKSIIKKSQRKKIQT